MTLDPSIQQNYRELHESTGESYESIAKRAASQGDKHLAAWLRSQATATEGLTELEARTEPPKGRTAAKQETAAADAAAAEAAAKEAADREAADAAAAEAAAKEAADKEAADAAAAEAAAKKAPVKK